MEMPSLSEEEFQLQFSNLDQDKVGFHLFFCWIGYLLVQAERES